MNPDGNEWVGSALERYAARTPVVDWATPSELRTAVRARVRRRRAAIGSLSTVVALLVALSIVSLQGAVQHQPAGTMSWKNWTAANVQRQVAVSGSPAEVAVEQAEQRFALALTDAIVAKSPTSNVVVSPESLAATLSMLELGAKGTTQQEIAKALGSTSLSPQEQAAGWNALTAQLAANASATGARLVDRDAVFLQRSLPVLTTFIDALKKNYGAHPMPVDFRSGDGSAVRAIDGWVSQVVGSAQGRLFSPGSLTESTDLVMVDAMHFSASWARGIVFPADQIRPSEFLCATGRQVPVSMMHLLDTNLRYLKNGVVQGVVLPYAGGRFEAVAIAPLVGSISTFVHTLTPASLDELAKVFKVGQVDLAMPSFSVASNVDLDSTLRQLGIAAAFNQSADFGGITQARLAVEAVAQSAQLTVGRYGTDAKAASAAASKAVSSHGTIAAITFNRPFIFVIRDNLTGAILFDAVVSDPGAS